MKTTATRQSSKQAPDADVPVKPLVRQQHPDLPAADFAA